MKINKKILLGSTAAMVALSPLAAQQLQAATVDVPAEAEIQGAISFNGTQAINFGILTQSGAGAGNATVTVDGAQGPGNGTLVPAGGTPSAGEVKVSAATGVNIVVTGVGDPWLLQRGGAGTTADEALEITALQFRAGTGGAIGVLGAPYTYSQTGSQTTLFIGAKLSTLGGVGTLKTGTYTGNVTVDVVYQ